MYYGWFLGEMLLNSASGGKGVYAGRLLGANQQLTPVHRGKYCTSTTIVHYVRIMVSLGGVEDGEAGGNPQAGRR